MSVIKIKVVLVFLSRFLAAAKNTRFNLRVGVKVRTKPEAT